jgi:addiction module RelE/StbE family toxin
MFKVFLSAQAQKDSKKIPPKDKQKIFKKLSSLETAPYSGKKLSGKLSDYYSLKIWPYRAIYLVKKNKEVWVVHLLHRQGVYK